MDPEGRVVAPVDALKFKIRRNAPVLGQWLPGVARRRLHRWRYRRRIRQAWAKRDDHPARLPLDHRVDFMVAGAQKAGTTALMEMLSQHRKVVVPVVKEPHFFDNEGFFGGKKLPIEEYHAAFQWQGPDKLYGEGTPRNMFARRCVERIHRYNPDIRLICMLRDPVERAFSAWNMNHGMVEERSFEDLVQLEQDAIAKNGPLQRGFVTYLSRGMYAHQVRHLRRYFKPEQLCFLRYADFRKDNVAVMEEVFRFLDLRPPSSNLQVGKSNVYRYDSSLDPETERELRRWFRPEVEALEELLDWDLTDWK